MKLKKNKETILMQILNSGQEMQNLHYYYHFSKKKIFNTFFQKNWAKIENLHYLSFFEISKGIIYLVAKYQYSM